MLPALHSLTYTPNALEQQFAALSHLPWAMLLHSGFADHTDNRFDILVAEPRTTLMTCGEVTHIDHQGEQSSSTEDPLSLVQHWLDHAGMRGVTPREDLPFQGGALGLFGYDLGRRFERLPQQAQRQLQTPDMAIGIYDWALIADHHLRKLTLICWGDLQQRLSWIQSQRPVAEDPFRLNSDWQSNMTREEYGVKFRQVQAWLRSGDCYQVNLSQRFHARYQGSEWQAFTRLCQANRAPFSAFIRLPQSTILSLSPERFIRLQDGEIQTRPIKGTLPRLADEQADRQQAVKLANSAKDRSENLMIVDLLRNDVGRVAVPGTVRVPELFVVEQFPAVHHLVSTITAQLKPELAASDLLRASFPGGSITGAPKVRAMEIIEELEPQRRNAWCGSIGYLSTCGNMDTSITIRTLIAEQSHLWCSAGGGIVADSEEEAEYQETFDKVNRILPCLQEPSDE